MEPTPANALLILRSSLCQKMVGHAMAVQANRMILAEMAEVPVELLPEPEFNLLVKRDLISSLEQQQCGHDCDQEITTSPLKKQRRNAESVVQTLKDTVNQITWLIQNHVTMWRAPEAITSAAALVASLSGSSSAQESLLDLNVLSHSTLKRGMLLLDGGVDRCLSDTLWNLREHGRFAGVAMATDESPPKQPRFRGLRFQITVMYWGAFEPVDQWERCAAPPIMRTSCLADICHCPGKRGVDVSRILEKQLGRVGLNCFDVVSCTGDGGGENEGQQGIHAYFENLSPGYVRRRCLPHIAWRTCDQAIGASGLGLKALAAYLSEGVTWTRLKDIATTSPA